MHNRSQCCHVRAFVTVVHILIIFTATFKCAGTVEARHTVESPDGKVVITFDVADEQGGLIYSVAFDGRPVIVNSRLGLVLKDADSLESGFGISNVSVSSHDSTYSLVYPR